LVVVEKAARKPLKPREPSRRRKPPRGEVRSNVGIFSPFALTEAKLKEKVPWGKISPEEARSLIGKALGMQYESLFNPANNSPLYAGLPRPLCRVQRIFSPLARLARSALGRKQAPGTGPQIATGGPASPCAATVKWTDLPQETYPEPPPLVSEADFKEPKKPYGTHPLQWCAADCYLIAALSSVAWTDPTLLTGYSDGLGNYEFQLASVAQDLSSTPADPFSADRTLPVDPAGALAFARSNEPHLVWPALHEKAYAIYRSGSPSQNPDITQLNYGNPLHALCSISWYWGDFHLTSEYAGPAGGTFDSMKAFGDINARCGSTETGNKSTYPLVAWTSLAPPPALDIAYTNDLVAANHSYSILGTWVDGARRYIILRNPFGLTVAPPIAGVTGGTWIYSDWYCRNGQNYLDSFDPKKPMKLLAPPGEPGAGVFAMEIGEFLRYFEGFGWVY
jgi:hypothetical protein